MAFCGQLVALWGPQFRGTPGNSGGLRGGSDFSPWDTFLHGDLRVESMAMLPKPIPCLPDGATSGTSVGQNQSSTPQMPVSNTDMDEPTGHRGWESLGDIRAGLLEAAALKFSKCVFFNFLGFE